MHFRYRSSPLQSILNSMSLSVKPLCHGLPLDVVTQNLLRGNLGILSLSRPLHPSPREGFSLESRGRSVKDKYRPDFIEKEFANSVIQPQKVGIGHAIALLVPEAPDGLIEPDGDIHSQDLVAKGLHWDRLPDRVQQSPQPKHSHPLT